MHRHLAALAALVLLPSLSPADVLINWGNNVSADTSPSGEYISGGAISFSTTSQRSPSSVNYTGVTYYGGAVATGTSGGVDRWFIDDSAVTSGFTAGDDLFNFRVNTADIGAVGYAVLLWKQEDFSGGLSTGDVTVTDLSVRARTAGSGLAGDVRFIVVSDGVTLISSAQSIALATAPTITLNDLSAQSWFTYDPASSISSIGSSYDVSGFAFANVSMAGVLLRQEKLSGTAGNMSVVMQSFGLNGVATSIPEPSAFAAVAGLLGLGWALRRRRA